ncbi:MAG: type VI secretion system Vgr family protein [bacterium]
MAAQAVSLRFTSSASGFSSLEDASPAVEIFEVRDVIGREEMSQLYEFDIQLYSDDPRIDGTKLIGKRAALEIEHDGDIASYHGIVAAFESDLNKYRVTLVPALWLAGLTRQCQVFLEKDVKTIVTDVLTENGLKADDDFSIVLNGAHPVHEYIVQYEETDLNFVQRIMEHEGVYFWFKQSEGKEKLFIRDAKEAHVPFQAEDELRVHFSGLDAASEFISSLSVRNQVLPAKVILKDYNYRKPSLPLSAEADAMKAGAGFTMEYGNHFKTPEEGKEVAKLRAQAILCREQTFEGVGGLRHFHPGFRFKIHPDSTTPWGPPFDAREFLLVRVTHTAKREWGLEARSDGERETTYRNTFNAIDWSIQYRPERKTPKPRIYGVMHAHIDAAASGEYAEIDDQGRYKVKLPFDLSDASKGKASKFVRMAQSYAGANYGMHFPLHKGIEILLSHVDGDPDRPIIVGAVPNPETSSPVTGNNQTQSAIHTAGGNKLTIEDTAGGQRIMMESPTSGTIISMGAPFD